MKRIALFVHNLTVEYSLAVAQGAASYFTQDKDIKLILAQTNQPHYPHGLYEYQYWASAELLKAKDVDLIMIVTSAYQTYTAPDELKAFLKPFKKKPVVSIAVDLPFLNSYYTISECEKAFDEVVDHLKNVHGCKNIGFLSATDTDSKEAIARYEAFKKALKHHNLELDTQNIIDGRFIREAAHEYTLDRYKTKENIKCDAFVASNDLMAEGCLMALQEMGVNVPKDIKLVGYDNTVRASFTSPSLSTMDQNIEGQGYTAAEIAHRILKGEKVPRETRIQAEPIYRQSCGCVKTGNTSFMCKNQKGEII